MFDFFKKPTEERILTKYVGNSDSVLVISPWTPLGYNKQGNLTYYPDLVLATLIRKIRNYNITVIDIQGGNMGRTAVRKYAAGDSDLFRTRAGVRNIISAPIKYLFSDALYMSIKTETFDVIVDKMTYQYIVHINEENYDKLIYEYNRVLKRNGKLIFFSTIEEMREKLIDKLKLWGYSLQFGKLNITKSYILDGRRLPVLYPADSYIVCTKKQD